MSSLGPDLLQNSEACLEQKQRTKQVERELKKMMNRLERDKVAAVFQLQVYAFNCSDRKHDRSVAPHPFHLDYVGGGGRFDVPNSLQATIKALEHSLAELKKRVQ
jgi:hypothetical protein